MINLKDVVSSFLPISLSEMDGVKLMNRTDTKFAFSYSKLPLLLEKIAPFYQMLHIHGKAFQKYKSLYYDTRDFKFYLDHHNQRVNRNKIRFREYVGSDLTFLEIKLKTNKKKTIKKRIRVDSATNVLNTNHKSYIKKIIGNDIDVVAKQWINFNRMTLVHKKKKERLTIDTSLSFKNNHQSGDFKEIIIAEVKQERMSRSSDFITAAKELSILPFRLSKYCMSTLFLNPNLKNNRFKEKILYIEKLRTNNLNL